MKTMGRVLQYVWWLAVGHLPLMLSNFYRDFHAAIGCPPRGDCYVPGSEHLFRLELQIAWAAALLWPVCFWFLVARPLLGFVRRARTRGARNNPEPDAPSARR